MTLREHYDKLVALKTPAQEFREGVAEACGVTEKTVYSWLSGEIIPEKLKREKIAELTGIPADELFPARETN